MIAEILKLSKERMYKVKDGLEENKKKDIFIICNTKGQTV